MEEKEEKKDKEEMKEIKEEVKERKEKISEGKAEIIKEKEAGKMKDKILFFFIGILVGSVITASGFVICKKINKNVHQMPKNEKMQMMDNHNTETQFQKPGTAEKNQNRPATSANHQSLKNDKTR